MEMTAGEICRSYRQAAKPTMQLKILAELNLTTKAEIKRILEERGIKVKQGKPMGRRPTIWTPEKVEAFEFYYAQGLNSTQMAPLLGVGRESIRKRICAEKESAPQLLEQLRGEVKLIRS